MGSRPKNPLRTASRIAWLAIAIAMAGEPVVADRPLEDASGTPPFRTGEVIGHEQVERLRDFLPKPFWQHREHFFFEGMQLEIGRFHADYGPSEERRALTARYAGQARIGPDDSLENYRLGLPFPEIAPDDPQAGVKHAWNLDYRHDASEGRASFLYTYWDNGRKLPLFYQGTGWLMRLARRTDYADSQGDVFEDEHRKGAGGVKVTAPPHKRGIELIGFRYLSSDGPRERAQEDDAWAYLPELRRVRRYSGAQRNDAIAGSDVTPDDIGSFSGIVPQYHWTLIGAQDVLSPIDSRLSGYPTGNGAAFGPLGFSLANDVWDLRRALVIEFQPKSADHIYSRKRFWVDAQTYVPLYSAAYDREGELWKLAYHAHRWSESPLQNGRIEGLRTFYRVCDVLVNVQTGTGNRTETFDVEATRLSPREIRKLTDVGRLARGR